MSKFNIGDTVKSTTIPSYGEGKVYEVNSPYVKVTFSGRAMLSDSWHENNLELVRKRDGIADGTSVKVMSGNHHGQVGKIIGTYNSRDPYWSYGYRVQFDSGEIRQYLPYNVAVVPEPVKHVFKEGDRVRISSKSIVYHRDWINNGVGVLEPYSNKYSGDIWRVRFENPAKPSLKSVTASDNDLELVDAFKPEPVKVAPIDYIVVKQGDKVLKKFDNSKYIMSEKDGALRVYKRGEKFNTELVGSWTQYGYTSATIESE